MAGSTASALDVVLNGTATDDLGVPAVQYSLDQGATWSPLTVTSGTFSQMVPTPVLDSQSWTIQVRATDSANQVAMDQVTLTVDTLGPVLAINRPAATQVMGPNDFNAAFAIGTVTDGSGGTLTVTVDLDDGNGPTPAQVINGNWTIGRAAPSAEDYVPHTLTARAADPYGNVTQQQVSWFADVVPPQLTITAPANGAAFDGGSFPSGDAVTVSWTASDGDPALIVTSPQSPGKSYPGSGSFSLTTFPSDNGVIYTASLTAATTVASTNASITFNVDRVAPTVSSFSIAPDAGYTPNLLVTTFSEPVWFGVPPVLINPVVDAGTVDATRTQYTVGLQGDVAYKATVNGELMDDYGNVIVSPPSFNFYTAPIYATNGQVLDTGVTDFEAATDDDGVLTVLEHVGNTYVVRQVDPRTGVPATLHTYSLSGATYSRPLVYAFQGLLNGLPIRGDGSSIWQTNGSLTQTLVDVYGVNPYSVSANALLPALPYALEGGTPGTFAVFNSTPYTYQRPGRSDVSTGLNDFQYQSISSTHWVLTDFSASPPAYAVWGCPTGASCAMANGTLSGATPGAHYSLAVGKDCDLHHYQVSGTWTTTGVCHANTSSLTDCFQGGFSETSTSALSLAVNRATETDFVAAAYSIGAGSSSIQIKTRAEGSKCTAGAGWTNYGSPKLLINLATVTNPVQAVVVNGKPGAVWLDSGGTLRVFLP